MFDCGIRGGITQALHRYAKASNNYMCDPEGESSFLQYLDANNLYGWALIKPLSTGWFKWADDDNVSKVTPDEIDRLVEDDSKSYLLEIDAKYPKELHNPHNGSINSKREHNLRPSGKRPGTFFTWSNPCPPSGTISQKYAPWAKKWTKTPSQGKFFYLF